MSFEYCLVLVTSPTVELAKHMAETVVSEQLAACVNIVPSLTSIYRWEGVIQCEPECQLLIKTSIERVDALKTRIHALHSYQVPEFLVIPVLDGSQAYLSWLKDSLNPMKCEG
jgi:periplasmic divalent cation tolerance protein